MVADGKTLQIPQALATTQDSQHRHQQQVPGRNAHPTSHAGVRDRPQKADQVEIGWDKSGSGDGEEAITPTSTHVGSTGQGAWDTLLISPGDTPPTTTTVSTCWLSELRPRLRGP